MTLGKENFAENLAVKLGYATAYFIFTLIIFCLLRLLNKLPSGWTFFHVAAITILLTMAGVLIERLLK